MDEKTNGDPVLDKQSLKQTFSNTLKSLESPSEISQTSRSKEQIKETTHISVETKENHEPHSSKDSEKEESVVKDQEEHPQKGIVRKKSLSFRKRRDSYEICRMEKKVEVGESPVVLRNKSKKGDELKNEYRVSYMRKTKGCIYYKRKGTFSKWKLYFVVFDDFKMQMNFFKSEEEYEKLAGCKMVIDLRFVNEIKPNKPKLLQGNFPFKMLRRAGLSTVKLAAISEVERAKWITTIEEIIKKVKMISSIDFVSDEKRSSTLPNALQSHRTSSGSETTTSASAPEQEEIIRPKKMSTSGFKLDSSQISSIKLKRISSEKKECQNHVAKKENTEKQGDEFDPKIKFGVNLRRVKTEILPMRNAREQSPEFIELKQKFNSLSLARTNRSPKLPFNDNLSRSYVGENISKQESKSNEPIRTVTETKEPKPKKCPSPKIPISKSFEAVIKNKVADDKIVTVSDKDEQKLTLNVCHATSAVISFDETSLVENVDKTENRVEKSDVKENRNKSVIVIPQATNYKRPSIHSIPKKPEVKPKPINSDNIQINQTTKNRNEIIVAQIEKPVSVEPSTNEIHDKNITEDKNTTTIVVDIKENFEENVINKTDIETAITLENDNFNIKKRNKIVKSTPENLSEEEVCQLTDNKDLLEDDEKVISKTKENEHINNEIKRESNSNAQKIEVSKTSGLMTQGQIDSIIFGNIANSDVIFQKRNSGITAWDPKHNEEIRFSIHSFHSQTSTESDEPLPRLNFLGKGDRSSIGSFLLKESLVDCDKKTHKQSYSAESLSRVLPNTPVYVEKGFSAQQSSNPNSVVVKELAELELQSKNNICLPLRPISVESDEKKKENGEFHNKSEICNMKIKEFYDAKHNLDIPTTEKILDRSEEAIEIDEKSEKQMNTSNIEENINSVFTSQSENGSKMSESNELNNLLQMALEYEKELTEAIESLETDKNLPSTELREQTNDNEKTTTIIEVDSSKYKANNQVNLPCDSKTFTNENSHENLHSENLNVTQQYDKSDNHNPSKSKETSQISHINQDEGTTECTSISSIEDIFYEQKKLSKINDGIHKSKDIEKLTSMTLKDSQLEKEVTNENKENNLSRGISAKSSSEKEENEQIINKGGIDVSVKEDTRPQGNQMEVVEKIENEEAQDYFPSYGKIEYRIKENTMSVLDDSSIRTSGIVGLKTYLKEAECDTPESDFKSGISKLGHSSAIETLKKIPFDENEK